MYRKKRTREHIIADLSANYVERFLLQCGHTVEHTRRDYGYDLVVFTFDAGGHPENGNIYVQLKATECPKEIRAGEVYSFQIDIRDVNLWINEAMPVIFILYDAREERAYWLYIQDYFEGCETEHLGNSVVVHVPKQHIVDIRAISEWVGYKNYILHQVKGLKRSEQSDNL